MDTSSHINELIQPNSLEEFHSQFQSEDDCIEYLFRIKWPNGYQCARCSCGSVSVTTTRRLPLYQCINCRYQVSLTVGTVMEGSRTELRKWLMALFLLSRDDSNIHATNLSNLIGVTYKTAWLMLAKIRFAMGEADSQIRLSGFVSVASANYGRPYNPSFYRHPQETPVLIGASMKSPAEPSYVKIKIIPDEHLDWKHILRSGTNSFTELHVDADAIPSYTTKKYIPLRQKPTYPLFLAAHKWLNETFHGLGRKHLQAYLNEYCYYLNMKLQHKPIFSQLSFLCTTTKSITYSDLTGGALSEGMGTKQR